MKQISVTRKCPDYSSYRAACVKSLFNADEAHTFTIEASLPVDEDGWQIGLIVGPSGSGKSTLGRKLFGPRAFHEGGNWPKGKPIIDVIAPDAPMDKATAALSAVGLGSVPSWLRPFHVLSTGEKFRADLARIVCESPKKVVIDEFTSVVDRQIARIGASAFAKAWRKTGGQAVLLSCHYDIIEWLCPDWILDMATGKFTSGRGLQRPSIQLDIFQTNWRYWPLFEPHHYLKGLPNMVAAECYVGFVGDTPVAHGAVSTRPGLVEAQFGRLVIMPEWQGAGIGVKFLTGIAHMWRTGRNRHSKPMPMLAYTSHPGLAKALRRHPYWYQIAAHLYGANKNASRRSLQLLKYKRRGGTSGYGGHFRAVQSFRYLGE
jgi:ABC-type ATPase involved in cell division